MPAVPAPLAGALGVPARKGQRGGAAPRGSRHPCSAWGSQGARVSRTTSGDAGLEAHESQPRQTPRNWLGQRRGRVSDPPPRHESAWTDLKNGDSPTIWCLRTLQCFACIKVSLFDS